jgi:hypothetical protein
MQDLNKIMEFDHVIRVTDYGTTEDGPSNVYAPDSVYVDVDSDGQIVGDAESDMIARLEGEGWTALNGWSSQYLYAGPIMHASEYVGGALAGYVLESPGLYVIVAVECMGPDEDSDNGEPAGWLILRREEVTD